MDANQPIIHTQFRKQNPRKTKPKKNKTQERQRQENQRQEKQRQEKQRQEKQEKDKKRKCIKKTENKIQTDGIEYVPNKLGVKWWVKRIRKNSKCELQFGRL